MTAITRSAEQKGIGPVDILLGTIVALAIGVGILIAQERSLYLFIGVIVFFFFVRSPILGLYITTVLLLISGSATVIGNLRLDVPVTAAKVCGFAVFLAWFTNVLVRREGIRITPVLATLIAFFLWSGLGVMMSSEVDLLWAEWFRLLTLVAYFFLVVHLLDTPDKVHRYMIILLGCGVVMSAVAVAQYLTANVSLDLESALADMGLRAERAYADPEALASGPAVRVSGLTGHSNWLAMVILVLLPLNAYFYRINKSIYVRGLILGALVLELMALILTFTRTGFLVGAVVLILLFFRNLVRFTPGRMAGVLLALFFAWFLLPPQYKERVLSVPQYTQSESVQNRMQLQEAAADIFKDNPVFGVGIGGFGPELLKRDYQVATTMQWFVDRYDWPVTAIGTHNMWLQIAAETGFVGLILFIAFIGLLIRELRMAQRQFTAVGDTRMAALGSSLEISLWSFIVCAFFLHALQQKIWWMMAAAGAIYPVYRIGIQERLEALKLKAQHTNGNGNGHHRNGKGKNGNGNGNGRNNHLSSGGQQRPPKPLPEPPA